ncbi:MAG TPA: hypothetical protein PLP05_03895 [Sedimentisphaerales bacterium]|nr:hypothetical protein [Sedimentisphaerales bacterium]
MKSLKQKISCLILVFLFSSIVCANFTYNFECITNNSAYNAGCGVSTLGINISDAGNSQAVLTFLNSGSGNSGVIEEIFFEDISGLMSFSKFEAFEKGVKFVFNSKKMNLPGGDEPEVDFTESYGFYASKPSPKNGLGLGETLSIVFKCGDFEDIISGIENGELRIGLHVISFGDGGSESFVNKTPPAVPVPGAIALAFVGIAVVLRAKKRVLI